MKKILYLLFSLCCIGNLLAQNPLTKRLDSLTHVYDANHFNGVILIGKGNQILYQNSFGFADLDRHIPMTIDKLFKTESVGKMFTSTRIMQLVEQGKVDLSKTVASYLPEWKIKNADKITIHQLLNHTSGLTSPWDDPNYDFKKAYSDAEMKQIIEAQGLAFDHPGERFHYSNSGYMLLGAIIAKLDKQPYDVAIRKSIFNKAGMKKIDHLRDTVMPATAAQPYFFYSSKDYIKYNVAVSPKASAAGGWITSASELYAFIKTYLSGALLQPATIQKQYTANGVEDITKKGYHYSYGFEVLTDDGVAGKTIIGHNGGGAGFSVDAYFEPKSGYIVIMCSNMYGTGRSISANYFSILFNQAPKKVQHNDEIRAVDLVQQKGSQYLINQTDAFFAELGVQPSTWLFINAAENLANIKDFEHAESFLAVSKKQFPKAAETWFVSGNIALEQKKLEEAKTAYEEAKALAQETKNDFIVQLANQKLEELDHQK